MGAVRFITWSRDGTRLATASTDQTVRVWNAATGKVTAALHEQFEISNIAWSPDGTRLAVATGSILDNGGAIRIWDVASGREIAVFEDDQGVFLHVEWSPDGTRLATASGNLLMDPIHSLGKVWDAATGKQIARLVGHSKAIVDIVWSPDGTRLATASFDGTARVWNARSIILGNLFEIACAHLVDTDVTGLARDYGIVIDRPICEKPSEIPLPPWTSDWDKAAQ
nr:hypothetical protein [Mesorhizobium sp. AR02]